MSTDTISVIYLRNITDKAAENIRWYQERYGVNTNTKAVEGMVLEYKEMRMHLEDSLERIHELETLLGQLAQAHAQRKNADNRIEKYFASLNP